MELRHARYFVAVAEALNFTRAAQRLHVAQSALSAQIRDLEHDLGVELFARTNRRVQLSSAGRAVLPEARRLLEQAAGMRDVARAAARGETGELRLGLIPPAATARIAAGLRAFARAHPGVRLRLVFEAMRPLVEGLQEGRFEALLGRPIEKGECRIPLRALRLEREQQGLAVPADGPLAAAPSVKWSALEGVRVLLLADNPHFGQLLRDQCASRGVGARFDACARDLTELAWLVSAGLGVCPFSPLLAYQLPPGAVFRPLASGAPRLELHLLHPRDHPHPLLDVLRECFDLEPQRVS